MKANGQQSYERPRIQTMHASSIIELLGPVSCGSGSTQEQSVFSGQQVLGGGDQNLMGQ